MQIYRVEIGPKNAKTGIFGLISVPCSCTQVEGVPVSADTQCCGRQLTPFSLPTKHRWREAKPTLNFGHKCVETYQYFRKAIVMAISENV